MKVIIDTWDKMASIQFKKGRKNIGWEDMTEQERQQVLNSLNAYYKLYLQFT
jgi:hypothetical protein